MAIDTKTLINDSPVASKKEKCESLFEEEWSKIYPGELEITWYYFPTAKSIHVDTKQIKGIYYCPQSFRSTIGQCKSWGMSFSPCWWASDMKRGFRTNATERGFCNVVIDIGDGTMKGFTTANIHALLAVLRQQCGPDVIVREGFPW